MIIRSKLITLIKNNSYYKFDLINFYINYYNHKININKRNYIFFKIFKKIKKI